MSSHWWYSLVSAEPDPEAGERVNVGLLIGNGRLLQLEYDPDLPRVRCITDPTDRRLLSEALRAAAKSLSRFEELTSLRSFLGPQVSISPPRGLYAQPDRRTIAALKERYLRDPSKGSAKRSKARRVSRIDDALKPILHRSIRYQLRKSVTPEKLYPEQPIFDVPVPALDRAVRSDTRDLLIGGVTVRQKSPLKTIQGTITVRLGRAFWHYSEAKERIHSQVGREVRTLGLVFNTAQSRTSELDEAIEYLEHVWGRDVDRFVVVEGENAEGADLEPEMEWLDRSAQA